MYNCIILFLLQCSTDCFSCTEWKNDGTCTKACGGGEQKQTRTCTLTTEPGASCDNDEEEQFIDCNTQEVHVQRFNFIVINSELRNRFIQIIHTHNVILITTKMDDIGWHGKFELL